MATNLFAGNSPMTGSDQQIHVTLFKLGRAIEELQSIVTSDNVDIVTELQDINLELDTVTAELQTVNSNLGNVDAQLGSLNGQIQISNSKYPALYVAMQVTTKNANGDPTEIIFYSDAGMTTEVFRHTITYDVDGDFESLIIS